MGARTRGQVVKEMLKQANTVASRPWVARLRVEYTYASIGRDLVEAGHLTGAREMAIGLDPFKGWQRELRGAAFHDMGHECDDKAAYPTAMKHMVPTSRDMMTTFLESREEIYEKFGGFLFKEETDGDARRRMIKSICNAFDNDAGIDSWQKKHGNPHNRSLKYLKFRLNNGTLFSLAEYWQAQKSSTQWMWDNAGKELQEFLGERNPKDDLRSKQLRWKSYVLQEAEACCREEKIRWAREKGVEVTSLQHDGVILSGDFDKEAAVKDIQDRASAKTGYGVRTVMTTCTEYSAIQYEDELPIVVD